MTITKYWLSKALGSWRMFWGFCPQCNSTQLTCEVCKGVLYSSSVHPKLWWKRYLSILDGLRSSDVNKSNN